MHVVRRRLALATGVALAALGGFPGHLDAQTAATPNPVPRTTPSVPPKSASATPTEEVVVTAERRSGTVQSTPISITAVTGAQLMARGITSVSQLGYETPGISEKNSGPGQTEFEMRGVASGGGSSPTTGFYLDDVPLTAPTDALEGKVVIDPNLYDLNRIEVLRGPQGTLYGSGSMGGTIRLITNQPDPTGYAASAQVTGSGTQGGGFNYSDNLMANFPILQDKLAIRIVGSDGNTSGWISRDVLDPFPTETNGGLTRGNVLAAPVAEKFHDVNNERLDGVHGTVFFQPIEDLTITPTAFYQKVSQGGPNYVDQPPGTRYEAHYEVYDTPEPYHDDFLLYTLPIKYSLPWFDITSITAYYHRSSSLTQDSSETTQDFLEGIIGIPNVPYAQAGNVTAYENDHSHQFSDELRLSSNTHGIFQWVIGGFYADFRAFSTIATTTPGPLVNQLFGAPSYFYLTFNNDIKQYAAFGEGTFQITPTVRLTAGLRYYAFQSEDNVLETGGLITGGGPPITFSLPASSSGLNPKLNLSYEPDKNLTLYTQVAKGFRPGGGNSPPHQGCEGNPLSYTPDTLWSYEAGEKTRLFGGKLVINGAVYYEDWTGIQQMVTEACGEAYTANAGTGHIYGGELETNWRVTPELTVSTAAGYAHAILARVEPGTGFSPGDKIQNVPDWTDTTSLVYEHQLSDRYKLIMRGEDVYTGPQNDVSYLVDHVPARNILNFRAGVIRSDSLSLFLFVNNATDKRAYIGDPEEIFSFVPSLNRATTNQPRTIGLELDYALGG